MLAKVPSKDSIEKDFPPGTVFANKYCVERVLGRGGMGAVLAARHMDLGHRVAIKVLHEEFANDPIATERFQREARATVSLESDHVVHVMDVGTDHGTSYMVMEFLEGEDLASIILHQGKVPESTAASWILEACDAVAEAHAHGIVHRDLKPANLFLAKRRRGDAQVKVLDFGISKSAPGAQRTMEDLTETHAILGTPHYASPEQLRGEHIDGRSDIWSLGVILHRLLTGTRPFEAETAGGLIAKIAADPPVSVRRTTPEVSTELEAIVARCLRKLPSERYANIAELAHALQPHARPELAGMAAHIDELAAGVGEASTRRAGLAKRPTTLTETHLGAVRAATQGKSRGLPVPAWAVYSSLGTTIALLLVLLLITEATEPAVLPETSYRPGQAPAGEEQIQRLSDVEPAPRVSAEPEAASDKDPEVATKEQGSEARLLPKTATNSESAPGNVESAPSKSSDASAPPSVAKSPTKATRRTTSAGKKPTDTTPTNASGREIFESDPY